MLPPSAQRNGLATPFRVAAGPLAPTLKRTSIFLVWPFRPVVSLRGSWWPGQCNTLRERRKPHTAPTHQSPYYLLFPGTPWPRSRLGCAGVRMEWPMHKKTMPGENQGLPSGYLPNLVSGLKGVPLGRLLKHLLLESTHKVGKYAAHHRHPHHLGAAR